MNRRHFITLSGAASLAAVATPTASVAAESGGGRDYYQLLQFVLDTPEQKKLVDGFLKDAAIPALNRMGMKPVGVFYPSEGLSPVYALMRFSSLNDLALLNSRLAEDSELVSNAADFLTAPASAPAFKRMESSVMVSFAGMPKLETPVLTSGRVFQLRIYESPSVVTGLKKIEMFNDAGEIKLFRNRAQSGLFRPDHCWHEDAQPNLHAGFQEHGRAKRSVEEVRGSSRMEAP